MGQFKDSLLVLVPILTLIVLLMASNVNADAMVTGSVFCDQCKDGERSFWDYPLYGARVSVTCNGAYKEESTNWIGSYTIRFEGNPDLSNCYAKVVSGPSGCGAEAGPSQGLNLMFNMFGMEMYGVNPLLCQPQQPMAFCPNSKSPPSQPAPVTVPVPPTQIPPPVTVLPPPLVSSPPPPVAVPPPPPPPVTVLPPPVTVSPTPYIPFFQASACTYEKWMMPEYKCYWKFVGPDTKVAVAWGPLAAGKYGTDMSLMEGLSGRGDVYRTLLREATAALLNSYNSILFPYPTLMVIDHMNDALLGSPQQALMIASRFRRANMGGYGNIGCTFRPCS